MDIQMPRLDGVCATRRHHRASSLADVLVLTTFDLDEYVFGALRAGASGFLLKDSEAAEVVDAVRTVARGEGMIAPAVTRRLIAEFARPGARAARSYGRRRRPADGADPARAPGAGLPRRRALERGGRPPSQHGGGDRQDPRQQAAGEVGAAQPHPGRRAGPGVGRPRPLTDP